ncbi:MAG: response regulator [Treponema sp.]|nr:response regulator [Treponema sp.]
MKTIFVVDDNNIILMTADEILSGSYDVFTFASVTTMFELLNDIKPDLILLDIMMPEINGFSAIKKLKADTRYAQIPVIFLTGKDDADTRAQGLEAGALDIILKPSLGKVLLSCIKKYC